MLFCTERVAIIAKVHNAINFIGRMQPLISCGQFPLQTARKTTMYRQSPHCTCTVHACKHEKGDDALKRYVLFCKRSSVCVSTSDSPLVVSDTSLVESGIC